jgi:antitoxin component YwqK of YwqJK toxin-antitoxin module
MKFSARSIILSLISTTIISSGEPTPEPIRVLTSDKIEKRNDIFYEVNQTTPFTGLVQEIHPNGKKKLVIHYKEGKRQGVEIE